MRELRQVGLHGASGRVRRRWAGALLTASAPHRPVAAPGLRAAPGARHGPLGGNGAGTLSPAARGQHPRLCATCAQLAVVADPPDEAVAAARAVTGRAPKSSRAWRVARDRSHLVVELDLGLRRKAVFTMRHGDSEPDSIVKHSLLGSKQRK